MRVSRQKTFSRLHKHRRWTIVTIVALFALVGLALLRGSDAANPNLPGDVNGDNRVTITDLSILLSNYGKPSATVDLNGDGQVTITDLSILLTNFGKTSTGPNPNPNPNPQPATYPLRVSADKRYLEGSNGSPFFWAADTAWNLSNNLNEAEWIQYLDARKAQGYNTIYTSIVGIEGWTLDGTTNRAGAQLFNNGNMATPNPAWFNSLDRLLALAAERGMQLGLWAAWLNQARDESSFTTGNMAVYGKFLGDRYKSTPNLFWVMGGDVSGCPKAAEVRALANAIKAADPNHLMTYHTGLGMISSDCYNDQPWLDINGAYWDFKFQNLQSGYSLTRKAYNNSPTRPTVMLEPMYEGPTPTRADADKLYPYDSRLMSAFQIMSGSMGLGHGMNSTFRMVNGHNGNTDTWQNTIKRPGGTYQGNIANFFRARYTSWRKMVPDQNNSVLTSGQGTYGQQNYALAGRASDGSIVIAFTPEARTMTIDMSKLSGSATARWYDATNASYRAISGSPFANSGSRQFQTPGNNSAGQSDWYLVIEVNPPS